MAFIPLGSPSTIKSDRHYSAEAAAAEAAPGRGFITVKINSPVIYITAVDLLRAMFPRGGRRKTIPRRLSLSLTNFAHLSARPLTHAHTMRRRIIIISRHCSPELRAGQVRSYIHSYTHTHAQYISFAVHVRGFYVCARVYAKKYFWNDFNVFKNYDNNSY